MQHELEIQSPQIARAPNLGFDFLFRHFSHILKDGFFKEFGFANLANLL
jgi:hypothetical protein